MVTVLGLGPDAVRVVDARRSGSAVDVVRVELGDVHLAGPLAVMASVLGRAAEGVAAIDAARRADTERCAGYGPDPEDPGPGLSPPAGGCVGYPAHRPSRRARESRGIAPLGHPGELYPGRRRPTSGRPAARGPRS
jgi:hypothetical protein